MSKSAPSSFSRLEHRLARLERENSALTQLVEDHRLLERSLQESEARYRNFIATSHDGVQRFELREAVLVDWPLDKQVDALMEHHYLAECNDKFAWMYGYENA